MTVSRDYVEVKVKTPTRLNKSYQKWSRGKGSGGVSMAKSGDYDIREIVLKNKSNVDGFEVNIKTDKSVESINRLNERVESLLSNLDKLKVAIENINSL